MDSNFHTLFLKKLQKSVNLWEHLLKKYHFWTIIKQKRQKVWQFEVMDCMNNKTNFQYPIQYMFNISKKIECSQIFTFFFGYESFRMTRYPVPCFDLIYSSNFGLTSAQKRRNFRRNSSWFSSKISAIFSMIMTHLWHLVVDWTYDSFWFIKMWPNFFSDFLAKVVLWILVNNLRFESIIFIQQWGSKSSMNGWLAIGFSVLNFIDFYHQKFGILTEILIFGIFDRQNMELL